MKKKTIGLSIGLAAAALAAAAFILTGCPDLPPGAGEEMVSLTDVDVSEPASTVKICFIHHSTGSAWISSGGLGEALNENDYYATETDYGWDAEPDDDLGSHTDTSDWPDWFNDTKMPYVYANTHHEDYTNVIDDPGGENEIIMFKSCFPCSEVGDSIDDEKGIYDGLLEYFAAHTDKLFILVIPPPEIDIESAELTRELSSWLADYEDGWLADYSYGNVFAFDYYNILTDPNNHHWVKDGNIVHFISDDPEDPFHPNELYYDSNGDDHPSDEGHQKATDEFLPILNAVYNNWKN